MRILKDYFYRKMSKQPPHKTRKYSPSKLEAAVRMVEGGSMSLKKAALASGRYSL